MPFLKQQIEIINQELRERSLKDARFQAGRYEAIAVDVSREASEGKVQTFPAIMSSNYEAQEITVDDTYPLMIYHKVFSKAYSTEKLGGYGDGNNYMVERADCRMVVYGKYAALKLTAEQLEALIATGFPSAIAKTKIAAYKLDSMLVTLTGSILNSAVVFQEEYKGFDLFLGPEDILFSMRYSIESKFRKGCFTICDCESSVT